MAILIKVRNGFSGQVNIDSCDFARSLMDDGDLANDRPSILLDVGWGSAEVTVSHCTIEANAGGGIALVVGPDTTSARVAEPTLHFVGNTITVDGADTAAYGILYQAFGERWLRTEMLEIRGNEIAHTGTGSGGFDTGIKVSIEPEGLATQTVNKTEFDLVGNTVRDCSGAGIHLHSDRVGPDASEHMATFQFDRNTITGCAGPGVHIDRGDDEGGYLNVEMYGNLIAENALGILVSGLDEDAPWALAGCTIVDNASFGIALDDSFGHVPGSLTNCIVYDNNACGDQAGTTGVGGTVTWDTTDVTVFEHNNWENLFSSCSCTPDTDGNVDDLPGFVDQAGGDYHLTATACSRNKGDNTPTAGPQPPELDIDGEARVYRGDGVVVIDQGADEYSGG